MQTKQATVSDSQSDEQAIRGLVDAWLTASEHGDLATMLNLLVPALNGGIYKVLSMGKRFTPDGPALVSLLALVQDESDFYDHFVLRDFWFL
jgi:hypothetical protein